MNLGQFFTIEEFERSETATKYAIDNTMTEEQRENAKELVKYILDPLRIFIDSPIRVKSGFRSPALNKYLRGAKNSQHQTAEAADIIVNAKAFEYIRNHLPFDQLIWEFGDDKEPQWVHVSYSKTLNRKQVLKATKKNGKTIYTRF